MVDEAQNLSPLEVKTIVTRVGEGTKVVFTGDPISKSTIPMSTPRVTDSPGWWKSSKGQTLVGHMTLTKGERGELAELAANLL